MPIKNNYKSSAEELISTKLPEQTKRYKTVSHEELILTTKEAISRAGLTVDREIYTSSNDCQIANGKYLIKDLQDKDMQLMIGWQNSYNKTLSLKFAIGTHIFICANGCVSGSLGAFKRKHTGDVQEFTPAMIDGYIQVAGNGFSELSKEKEGMKEIILTDRDIAEMLGRIYFEEDILTSTQLNIVKDELKRPTFNYGAPKSMWELYNYVTYSLKGIPPRDYFSSHIKIHEFFIDKSGYYHSEEVTVSLETKLLTNEIQDSGADAQGY